jgi:hypothetical protein
MEVLTWILGSKEENFKKLNRPDDEKKAVVIGNPRGAEFEVLASNMPLPYMPFRQQFVYLFLKYCRLSEQIFCQAY